MNRLLIIVLTYGLVCGTIWPLTVHATIDPVTNFAFGTVSTGYDSVATSVIASSGVGAKFPSSFPYNIVWWNCTDYGAPHLDPSVEIIRVTNRVSDTFTITRAQEGTSAVNHNTGGKTYCLAHSLTKKTIDDIRTDIANAGGAITDVVDAQSYANLNAAISDLCGSAAIKTLRISNTQTLSSNATVCRNVTVWIIGSGVISINNTVVLNIQAPVVAPVRKIFDGLGTVSGLTFSRGEWFGCVRDGATDDTACLQKAISAIASVGGQLNLGVGTYRITASLTVGSFVAIEGFGPAATFIKGALTTSLVKSPNQANKFALWHFRNFTIDNTAKTNAGGICLDMTNLDDSLIENVYLQNCDLAYKLNAGSGQTANNNVLQNVDVLTANTGYQITKAEWTNAYHLRANNAVNCIDLNDNTYISLYSPKCEAFTNGIRISNTTASVHTKLVGPFLKNTPTVGTGISIGAGSTSVTIYDPFYSGLTTNFTSAASAGQVSVWDNGALAGVDGISKTLSTFGNLNGSCTFAAATTCAVTFGATEVDTAYKLQLSCSANKTFWWSAKTTTGFTVNASSSSSDTCDWWLNR